MASLWTNDAIAAVLRFDKTEQDAAVRTGEAVTALVERHTHLTLIRRDLPVIYRTAAEDPIELPEHWRPNVVVREVRGSDDKARARADWPEIGYDFDGVRLIYSTGGAGWPAQQTDAPGRPRQWTRGVYDGPRRRSEGLPSVSVLGSAGVLEAPLDANLAVAGASEAYADLFGAAEDLLRIVWAHRQSGPLQAAEDIESGDNRLRWAQRWPQHVRDVLSFYSHPNFDGEEGGR